MKSYHKKASKFEQNDFDQVKLLLEKGLKPKQVQQVLGWGYATIMAAKDVDTLEQYSQKTNPNKRNNHTNGETKKEAEPTYPMLGEKLDEVCVLLREISGKLNRVNRRKLW